MQYSVEVRWSIFICNLTVILLPRTDRKYSHTSSCNFVMTAITQDDHHTAGAWTECDYAICISACFDLLKLGITQSRQVCIPRCLSIRAFSLLLMPLYLFMLSWGTRQKKKILTALVQQVHLLAVKATGTNPLTDSRLVERMIERYSIFRLKAFLAAWDLHKYVGN